MRRSHPSALHHRLGPASGALGTKRRGVALGWRFLGFILAALATAVTAGCSDGTPETVAEPADDPTSAWQVPRTAHGDPDLNGIWQALGTAHWELEAHSARQGPFPMFGALGAIPAGLSVVEGGTIPYQDWALRQRDENRANWLQRDPAVKCYMPGIPRAVYMPFPFQFVQTPDAILAAYEFASTSRIIHLNRPGAEAPLPAWMGHSLGHWDGDSLVVEVTDQVPDTWLDAAGNFHSEALKVTERYTRVGADVMRYEATLEDPEVFTRPWRISMPLYRRLEDNAQLLEFKCVEFAEEATYGHLYAPSNATEAK